MKVKVFYPNREGKIEFTRQELEKLLDEVYREGQKDCNCSKSLTWTTPYYNNSLISNSTTDVTLRTPELPTADNAIDNFKAESVEACNVEHKPFTVTMRQLSEQDKKRVSEELTKLLNANRALRAHEVNDVFSNLAKELNF